MDEMKQPEKPVFDPSWVKNNLGKRTKTLPVVRELPVEPTPPPADNGVAASEPPKHHYRPDKEIEPTAFGKKLRSIQLAKGLSQAEIYRRMKPFLTKASMSRGTPHTWLSGKNVPGIEFRGALAQALGVELSELFDLPDSLPQVGGNPRSMSFTETKEGKVNLILNVEIQREDALRIIGIVSKDRK